MFRLFTGLTSVLLIGGNHYPYPKGHAGRDEERMVSFHEYIVVKRISIVLAIRSALGVFKTVKVG